MKVCNIQTFFLLFLNKNQIIIIIILRNTILARTLSHVHICTSTRICNTSYIYTCIHALKQLYKFLRRLWRTLMFCSWCDAYRIRHVKMARAEKYAHSDLWKTRPCSYDTGIVGSHTHTYTWCHVLLSRGLHVPIWFCNLPVRSDKRIRPKLQTHHKLLLATQIIIQN